jgi:hypothetical protein
VQDEKTVNLLVVGLDLFHQEGQLPYQRISSIIRGETKSLGGLLLAGYLA